MRYVLMVAAVFFVACESPVELVEKRPLHPVPEEYAVWYAEVEDCLGEQGNFSAAEWFVTSRIHRDERDWTTAFRMPNEIIVMESVVGDPTSVKEMIIHHIRQDGDAEGWSATYENMPPCSKS